MAEKKLHESEQRFEHIYDNLSLGIRSLDVQKKEMILVTPGIEEITGYPPEFFYKKVFGKRFFIQMIEIRIFRNILN